MSEADLVNACRSALVEFKNLAADAEGDFDKIIEILEEALKPAPRAEQELWDAAAGDAHDALHRMREIQESAQNAAEDDERILDEFEELLDLDITEALEMAEAAEDVKVPA